MPTEYRSPEDSPLIRAAAAGDPAAFETLVWRYQAGIRAFAAVRLSSAEDADDVAQETFILAWNKLSAFDPETSFGAWLRKIALNLVLNQRRKFRAEGVGGFPELEALLDTHQNNLPWDAPERLGALGECLSVIDGPALALLHSRYTEGLSVRDIAAHTGRGYSALTMQLHRIREILAGCIEEKLGPESTQA